MRATRQGALRAFWNRRGLGNAALLPLSLLFLLAASLRSLAYRARLLPVYRAPVPVIVAGCITAGGGGKTTLVMALVEGLRERGLKPGVVSRGHGRRGSGAAIVTAEGDAAEQGDEATLVSARTGAPVAVAERRPEAARLLLERHPDTDVIVSDDGLQHLALGRDAEIAVLSEGYGLGNGWPMPAGPLREPASRLRSVDAIVRKGKPQSENEFALELVEPELVDGDGSVTDPEALAGKTVAAVSGIAEPDGFLADLRRHGVEPDAVHAFPDHHPYAAADLEGIKADVVVMTEKDEIKCRRLEDGRILVFRQRPTLQKELLDKLAALVDEAGTA